MDSFKAMAEAEAARARGAKHMVFDWKKAAELIVKRQPKTVSAGLSGDWEWTGGLIWQDGNIVHRDDTYTYLASNWATPEIEINGEREPCFVMLEDSPGWDASTYWPEEALKILSGGQDVEG